VATVALFAAAAVFGDTGKEKIKLNRADQAAARAAAIRQGDLGAGWEGGPKKPDLTPSPTCANYHPKQSDLVLTGAAASEYKNGPIDFHSEVNVLQTARMVRLDWQRTVLAPGTVSCLRHAVAKALGARWTILSYRRIPFPHLAQYAAEFRGEASVTLSSGGKVRILLDSVVFGRRRTEISLSVAAPLAAANTISAVERHLARTLVARARV
jgi:hypothetical protein